MYFQLIFIIAGERSQSKGWSGKNSEGASGFKPAASGKECCKLTNDLTCSSFTLVSCNVSVLHAVSHQSSYLFCRRTATRCSRRWRNVCVSTRSTRRRCARASRSAWVWARSALTSTPPAPQRATRLQARALRRRWTWTRRERRASRRPSCTRRSSRCPARSTDLRFNARCIVINTRLWFCMLGPFASSIRSCSYSPSRAALLVAPQMAGPLDCVPNCQAWPLHC